MNIAVGMWLMWDRLTKFHETFTELKHAFETTVLCICGPMKCVESYV